MARKTNMKQFAKPAGGTVTSLEDRIDTAAKALGRPAENSPAEDAPAKKIQRNREGMAKATIHMSKAARDELKIAGMRMGEGLEEFILTAINERLVREKVLVDGKQLQVS